MVILISFFVFLLVIYLLSREDFVFMRKNITLESIFDMAFINGVFALLFARIIFVAFHFKMTYLNPLVFLIVPYFPGLSISGVVIGSFLFILWFSKIRKIPVWHVMDIFSVGFFYAFSISLFGYSIFSFLGHNLIFGAVQVMWGLITLSLSILFGSIQLKTIWKDGSMSSVTIAVIFLVVLITKGISMYLQKPFNFDREIILVSLIVVISIVLGVGKKFMQRSRL
ncbi:MAG TPA: prolipoprotein diacylglyceryl transferase family protein [Patescibacteria group bacterium]